MSTLPSPKRRRQGDSQFEILYRDQPTQAIPEETKQANENGFNYQLYVERAFAHQRFQATMSHIFDKYGRNFDGIGDEIDLVTGDIVVDNGHISNMRNEGDVGDGRTGQGEEGVWLEDLSDEPDHDDFDHYKLPAEQETATTEAEPTSGKMSSTVPNFPYGFNPFDPRLAAFLPALYAGAAAAWGSQAGNLEHNQFPFGPSSFPAGPWGGLPTDYSMPPWVQPGATAGLQTNMPQIPTSAAKYNFPVQNGRSSLWAAHTRYKEDAPLRRSKSNKRPNKECLKNRVNDEVTPRPGLELPNLAETDPYDGGEENEAWMPLEPIENEANVWESDSDSTDDSDFFWENRSTPLGKQYEPNRSERKSVGNRTISNKKQRFNSHTNKPRSRTRSGISRVAVKRQQHHELKEKLLAAFLADKEPSENPADESEGRRRSGRDRKTVEPRTGMVSWDRVKAETYASHKAMMKIRSERKVSKLHTVQPDQNQLELSEVPPPSAMPVHAAKLGTRKQSDEESRKPIEQTDQSNSVSENSGQSVQNTTVARADHAQIDDDFDKTCTFSDDEAPALLTRILPSLTSKARQTSQQSVLDFCVTTSPRAIEFAAASPEAPQGVSYPSISETANVCQVTLNLSQEPMRSTCPDSTDMPLDQTQNDDLEHDSFMDYALMMDHDYPPSDTELAAPHDQEGVTEKADPHRTTYIESEALETIAPSDIALRAGEAMVEPEVANQSDVENTSVQTPEVADMGLVDEPGIFCTDDSDTDSVQLANTDPDDLYTVRGNLRGGAIPQDADEEMKNQWLPHKLDDNELVAVEEAMPIEPSESRRCRSLSPRASIPLAGCCLDVSDATTNQGSNANLSGRTPATQAEQAEEPTASIFTMETPRSSPTLLPSTTEERANTSYSERTPSRSRSVSVQNSITTTHDRAPTTEELVPRWSDSEVKTASMELVSPIYTATNDLFRKDDRQEDDVELVGDDDHRSRSVDDQTLSESLALPSAEPQTLASVDGLNTEVTSSGSHLSHQNHTPSTLSSEKRKTSRASSSKRRSLLSLIKDDDDAGEFGGTASTKSKRTIHKHGASRKSIRPDTSKAAKSRTSGSKRHKTVKILPEKVNMPRRVEGVCGVDGYTCDRDFCFTCL